MMTQKDKSWTRKAGSSLRPDNKHQKLPESNMWPASGEQMQNVFTT